MDTFLDRFMAAYAFAAFGYVTASIIDSWRRREDASSE
jgi:hypothetical protein